VINFSGCFRTLNIFYVLQIWLSLATRYIKDLRIDWNKVLQFAFNDKCNPDDDALGAQIVKVRETTLVISAGLLSL